MLTTNPYSSSSHLNFFKVMPQKLQKQILFKNKEQKQKEKKAEKIKLVLRKFIDPFLPHRITGDFIIPDKLSQYQGDYLYSYQLDLTHKILTQFHMRKHGVILEYEDNEPYSIPPMELVQSRLESLGNIQAYELSKYLLEFQQKMQVKTEKFPKKSEPEAIKLKKTNNEKIFAWMDSIFAEHEDDLVFMRGNRIITQNDFKMCFMGFNFKFLEWVVGRSDLSYLDDLILEEISKCFVFRSVESYMDEVTNFIKSKLFNIQGGAHEFVLDIKTLVGVFSLKMNFSFRYFQEENKTVFCFIHPKALQRKEIREEIEKIRKEFLNKKKRGCDWGRLVLLYYQDYSLREGPENSKESEPEEERLRKLIKEE